MAPQDVENLRSRPRSNTTTFSSFSAAWRKQKPETPSPPSTAPLSVDELIQALTPPAVPGLAHARALATALCTYSPLPRLHTLNPILAALCSADAPVLLQAAGFEILAGYWENGEAASLELADRMTYFTLFTGSGDAGTTWSTELWEPKFKALRAITKYGVEILGIEIPFFDVLKTWIMDAFEDLFILDPHERAERAERERSIEILSAFLNTVIEQPEVMARITEDEFASVLDFYGKMVDKCIQLPPSSPGPKSTTPASPVEPRPSYSHRRQQSSISLSSLPSPTFATSPLPSPQPSIKQPVDIAVSLYLNHLTKQLNLLPPTALDTILPFLFRALASCASPLPRLTVRHTAKRSKVEERVSETLNSLLSGPYSSTCFRILQRNLYPIKPSQLTSAPSSATESVRMSIQTSFGAQRSLREHIRRTLTTRLARAYISKESATGYSHSGAPAHLDLSRDMIERAWGKDEFSGGYGGSSNGWDAARFRKALKGSTKAWVDFLYPNLEGEGANANANEREKESKEEEEPWVWVKDGKERILEEIAGILKDVLQEIEAREEDDAKLDEEEARTVGETLYELAEYVLVLRNPDGTPYLMPLSQPSTAASPFLRILCSLLALDHTTIFTPLTPLLSTTLLHISAHLFDSDTSKLPEIMKENLSPTSPDWLDNWKDLLESPLAMNSRKPLTRKAVMRVLESAYENVKDLRVRG